MNRPGSSAGGFTLLEVLLGISVLGLCAVAALQVFGSSLQMARTASRKSEAVVHARALMDSALWSPILRFDTRSGEIGNGYRWQRTIRRAGPEDGVPEADAGLQSSSGLNLAVISVAVEWNEPSGVKSYQIGTMRIVPTDE